MALPDSEVLKRGDAGKLTHRTHLARYNALKGDAALKTLGGSNLSGLTAQLQANKMAQARLAAGPITPAPSFNDVAPVQQVSPQEGLAAAKAETAARNQLSAQQAALAQHKAEAAVASEVPQARAGLRGGVDLNVGSGATINKAAPIDLDVGGGKTRGVINTNPVTMGEKLSEGLRGAGQSVANRMPSIPNPNITREGIKAAATKAGNVGMRGLGAVGGLMSARAALNADNWGDRLYHGVDAVAGGLTAFKPTMLAGMALGLGNQAVHGLAGGFNEGPSEANGTVDPKEVARQIAERRATQAPAPQLPTTEALPERTLEQAMAGRANNMNRLQGEVLRAKDTLSDAQANTMALAPLGGQASAVDAIINPMRMAAHTQQERAGLQRAMGEYGMAGKAQAHDDTTGLKQEEITMQNTLALAKMRAEQANANADRIGKFQAGTTIDPKTGMQVNDEGLASQARRIAEDTGVGFNRDGTPRNPMLVQAGLQGAADDALAMNNYNEVASANRKLRTAPQVQPGVDTVGLEDVLPGGAGLGAALRAKFTTTPNQVMTVRTPDGMKQRILSTDLSGGVSDLRARYAAQAGLKQASR